MKKTLGWIMAVVLAWSLAGCQESPKVGPKKDKPRVDIFIYREDDAYISMVLAAMQKAFAGRATTIVHFAGEKQLVQNRQIDEVLAAKTDALVVNLVDTQSASMVVDKAKKAGIPAVFFNREPDLNDIKHYERAAFVGSTIDDAGRMQGGIIKNLWLKNKEYDRNKDGQFQYVMFQGNPDNPEALARTELSVRQARESGVNMQQIGETYVCFWDGKQAYEAMRRSLKANADKIELVIANNDAMALGAIAALNEAGFNTVGGPTDKFIPVVGVDATAQAIEAIKKGIMSGTVKQDGESMAMVVADLAMNAANGQKFLHGTSYAWDESGVAVRIGYEPFCLKDPK